jgi:hypothetical protein
MAPEQQSAKSVVEISVETEVMAPVLETVIIERQRIT